MLSEKCFTKENLDTYLNELAKEYRKMNGRNVQAEIVLVGGAAVLANYGFRMSTGDIDAAVRAVSSIKDAINRVGDKYELPNGWLNADFMHTASYSPKILQYCKYYKRFAGVLEVRTMSAEYLIAMKLRSGRKYKNDLSDIIGILAEHEKLGAPITFGAIDKAVHDLYDGWSNISEELQTFVKDAINHGNLARVYTSIRETEVDSKELVMDFEKKYPGVLNESNINEILNKQRKRPLIETMKLAQAESERRNAHAVESGDLTNDAQRE